MTAMTRSACTLNAGLGIALAFAVGTTGCALPAPPAAPVARPSPIVGAPATPVVDLHALEARFLTEGLTMVLGVDDIGRVLTASVRKTSGARYAPKDGSTVEHASVWLRTYGDALGYGRLGAARPESDVALPMPNQVERVLLHFPEAEGCPDLVAALTYPSSIERRLPLFTELFCPSAPDGPARLARLREGMSEGMSELPSAASQPPPSPKAPAKGPEEPFAIWLRSEGYVITAVVRTGGTVNAQLERKPSDPGVPRRTFAARFGKSIARAAGLPDLDAVVGTDFNASPRAPKPHLRSLSLRQSSPPLDGACIDPEVVVTLGEPFDSPADADYWVSDVRVICEHEPSAGPKPPADAARRLPATARRAQPYLAVCTSTNFAWGYHNAGSVIDKRGDVYTFRGGRPLSGTSSRELAILARHEKTYVGTLPPADVDRLSELIEKIDREPLVRTAARVADGGGGGCSLFKGGSVGGLGSIQLDSYGADHNARRNGPVAAEVSTLLGRAKTLAARGN